MRVGSQDAYILRRRPYRETSLLLEAFAKDYGVLSLVAKGALRNKGTGNLLQAFQPLKLSWSGRTSLATLTDAECSTGGISLRGAALFCGFYLNELLWRLLPPHDPHPQIFDDYREALNRMAAAQDMRRIEATLRLFELALLREIGYGPLLECDAESGEAIRPELHYTYCLEKGPVVSGPGVSAFSGASLLGLREGRLSGLGELREAKRLMRGLIDPLLDGKPLKSRELFNSNRMPADPGRERAEESSCLK